MLPTGQLVIFSPPVFFQSPIIFDQAKIANREMIRFKKVFPQNLCQFSYN